MTTHSDTTTMTDSLRVLPGMHATEGRYPAAIAEACRGSVR
ncbi:MULTISPECIES: hypothetical protein [Streptomyces]|nr:MULTISPECIES: hypothetical protein [Streptomyces]